MVDNNCIIEGNVKFRDGKKWKSRWCVMRKLSPVADCLHLQLYGDSKDRYKQGQTKASLSLQHFLGVESGFTLDKESNTIAIICQDLTVVLAFDTRERLIQWQVKISNNLGEDQQFLIIISTAPSKAKLVNGPAHLHVQDRRFCITVGIPPRLIGIWDIAHLRRYGVVEGRFCFEGGSRCGRGEGLHVLVTDQGDDITKTFQLAADGKLTTRKRPIGRDNSIQESPRRQFSRSETRASDFFPTTVYTNSQYDENCEGCKNDVSSSSCWSSTESRHKNESETDYNCRDTVSVSELMDQPGEWRSCSLTRQTATGLERCASCISKLGTISKSSTSGTTGTGMITRSPVSRMENSSSHLPVRGFDRSSLSSYSSSSHESDYSSAQQSDCQCSSQTNNVNAGLTIVAQSLNRSSPSPTATLPPRPIKPSNLVTTTVTTTTTTTTVVKKLKKPPMPLPNEQQACTCQRNKSVNRNSSSSGPYENYDVPKTILGHHMSLEPSAQNVDQYYDTPRKIKECLALPKIYPNYDTPHVPQAVVLQQCGCPTKLQAQSPRSSGCPCHNVMSWAGFVLPYCRRGAGIEPTGVTVHPVKLSGEGKMPVVNASGELGIYDGDDANNDDTLKLRKNKNGCECTKINDKTVDNNYENFTPVIDTQPESSKLSNYVNLNFTESLEHYENSKDVLSRTGITRDEIEEIADELVRDASEDKIDDSKVKICVKCGHAKEKTMDYLIMNPDDETMKKKSYTGYLTMQPAHNACSKEILSRICGGAKSSSNPTLFGSSSNSENLRKRSDSEFRVPGSAMLSSPYLRRRLIDSTGNSDVQVNAGMLWRKRSYSAESAHYLDETNSGFTSNLTVNKISGDAEKSVINSNDLSSTFCVGYDGKKNCESDGIIVGQPFSIKIRRSSSVPSKTGHNRDSSSSNDSGVSTGSLSHRTAEFVEFETSVGALTSTRKQNVLTVCRKTPNPGCFHDSLPRKSKSSDPLRELSFQFQKIKVPTKSSSAEGDIPTCLPKNSKGFGSPGEVSVTPYIDSRSTSSGTSDMSDYIETLSLSSHSSSDTPDSLRLGGRAGTTTLRPRSGKEYYKIDRSILVEQGRNQLTTTTSTSYANITPVIEKSESPSPGYMSSSPFEQPQPTRDHFMFPEKASRSTMIARKRKWKENPKVPRNSKHYGY